jgi:hypothetical protein
MSALLVSLTGLTAFNLYSPAMQLTFFASADMFHLLSPFLSPLMTPSVTPQLLPLFKKSLVRSKMRANKNFLQLINPNKVLCMFDLIVV